MSQQPQLETPENAADSKPIWLTRLALSRPVTICMLFISMLLFGGLASRLLPLEMFPGIDIPELYVNVPYPNATPSEVERLITRPLEEALATVSGIKELRSFANENSGDVSLQFRWSENISSKSLEVRERLDTVRHLLQAGAIGALLSFVVLYLFLRHLTTTLVVVLSVPAAIIVALGAMYFLGYSLNILSMMGLMLAIGMLVDNAVVVTESIFRERALGGDVRTATERGVKRVGLAVLAGTATTAIVFLPNIIGEKMQLTIFLEHVAIAICLCLAISLLLALTLIPLLTTRLKVQPVAETQGSALDRFYRRALTKVMNWPKTATALAILVLLSAALPLSQLGSSNEDEEDRSRLFLNYNIQGNYSLEEVRAEVSAMEAFLYSRQQDFFIESVYSYYRSGHAISIILLQPDVDIDLNTLKDQIRQDWPPLVRARPSFSFGNNNNALQLHLLGNSTERLLELAAEIEPALQVLPSIAEVSSDLVKGLEQF